MSKIKQRESNFELLRIFAMLGIIFHHIIYHGVRLQLVDEKLYNNNELFNTFDFYKNYSL